MILNKMILNRILHHIEGKLRDNQNGARRGTGTSALILALRRLIEGVMEYNLKAVAIFIDYSRAFDSLDRRQMLKILSE